MTTQQTIKALLTETEQLWLAAIEAQRAAAAKEREYKAALFASIEARVKESNDNTNNAKAVE